MYENAVDQLQHLRLVLQTANHQHCSDSGPHPKRPEGSGTQSGNKGNQKLQIRASWQPFGDELIEALQIFEVGRLKLTLL